MRENKSLRNVSMTGLMAALSYVVFTFLQFKIPIGTGDATSIHLGNAVCVLGALLFGGWVGGLGGAIGMTLGDLFDPIYVVYAPKTFVCKLGIGLITGLVAHRLLHIESETDPKALVAKSTAAAAAGLAFNVVFDPLIGYVYKLAILDKPAADVALAFNLGSTGFNAVISLAASVAVYAALRPALKKAGFSA